MENDGLPDKVCLQCTHYIIRSFSFKQLCEKSDSTLRQILNDATQTFLELKPYSENIDDLVISEPKECDVLEPKIESVDIEILSMLMLFVSILYR